VWSGTGEKPGNRRDSFLRWVLGLAFCANGVQGCAARSTTTISDYDETGRPTSSYSVQATVTGKENARIDEALARVRDGDYAGGIAILEGMNREPSLSDSWRQEVLIQLGEIHGMPLNPRRDPKKAATFLEELLRRYPDSKHAQRARELLHTYGIDKDD